MRTTVSFSDTVTRHVDPAMVGKGMHRKGKRIWWERRGDGSWVILEIQMRNGWTRTGLSFTVNTAAWPPATWEYQQTVLKWLVNEPLPYASGAPVSKRPRFVAPELWPSDDDFLDMDLDTDFERIGEQLRDFLLAALEWARERSDVEGALGGGIGDHWALHMLRSVAPDDPRLTAIEERYGLPVEPGPASGPAAVGD